MTSRAVSVHLAIVGSALALCMHLPRAHAQAPSIATTSPALTHYTEVRVAAGGGTTTSGKQVGEADEGVVALNLSLGRRDDSRVIGANLNVQTTGWGANYFYFGGVLGFALGSGNAHLELLGEVGVHHLDGLGADFLSAPAPTESDTADLLYAGAQLRAVFDLGAPGGLKLELTAQGRSDLTRDQRDLHIERCFLSCSSHTETWTLGGTNASVLAGLSYQFDD